MNVTIDTATEARLWAFIRAVESEIGGWGYAQLDGEDLLWHEVFLVPQEVSTGEVDFQATAGDVTAIERAAADGVLDDPSFVWVSWHSHNKMKAFWSATDEARIRALAKTGMRRLLSFVGSHDGSYQLRLDIFDVHAHGIHIKQVTLPELTLAGSPDNEFMASIRQEITGNVKPIQPPAFLCPWPDLDGRQGELLGLLADRARDEPELDVEDTLAVRDLIDRGYSHHDALMSVLALGVNGVADLIEQHDHEDHQQPIGERL